MVSCAALLQPFCPLEIFLQLARNLVGYVRAGTAVFRAQAFLRGGPDHVAVFVYEPHRRNGFVPALRRVLRFILANAKAGIASGT